MVMLLCTYNTLMHALAAHTVFTSQIVHKGRLVALISDLRYCSHVGLFYFQSYIRSFYDIINLPKFNLLNLVFDNYIVKLHSLFLVSKVRNNLKYPQEIA